jgi:uncharacterized protein (DUF433 family)
VRNLEANGRLAKLTLEASRVIDDQRRVVAEAARLVDFDALGLRGKSRRRDLVVDAPENLHSQKRRPTRREPWQWSFVPFHECCSPVMIDWSTCSAVERDPDRFSGAWVFRGTRVPVAALFENQEDGTLVSQFVEWFPGVTLDQARAVLEHAARSALAPA